MGERSWNCYDDEEERERGKGKKKRRREEDGSCSNGSGGVYSRCTLLEKAERAKVGRAERRNSFFLSSVRRRPQKIREVDV